MSKTQRTVTIALWCLVVVSLMGLLAMHSWQSHRERQASRLSEELKQGTIMEVRPDGTIAAATQRSVPIDFDAPAFKLTDQQNQAFDSGSLKGKVWAAAFFFSQCDGICPGMLGKVQKLAKAVDDPNVHIAYFTVDPANDTPERLRAYAEEAGADPERWHMLTGELAEMQRIGHGFHVPFATPAMHTGKIFLIDQAGVVRGYYEQREDAEMAKLAIAAKKLLAGEPIQ